MSVDLVLNNTSPVIIDITHHSSNHTLTIPTGFNYFKHTILFICVVFGVPGNILTLVLCYRSLKRSNKNSSKKTSFLTNFFKLFQLKRPDSELGSVKSSASGAGAQQTCLNGGICLRKTTSKRTSCLEILNNANIKLGKLNGQQRKSFELFLIQISVFDILMLLYWFSDELIDYLYTNSLTKLDTLMNLSDFSCKFFLYMNRVNGLMVMWLTFAITLIRCVVISKPLSVRYAFRLNKVKSNIVLFVVLLVVCLCANLNVFVHFGFEKRAFQMLANGTFVVRQQCSPITNSTMARYMHNYGLGIVGYSLPSISIFFMNLFIVYKILSSWHKFNNEFKIHVNKQEKVQGISMILPNYARNLSVHASSCSLNRIQVQDGAKMRRQMSVELIQQAPSSANEMTIKPIADKRNPKEKRSYFLSPSRNSETSKMTGRYSASTVNNKNYNYYYDSFRSRIKRKRANLSIFNSLVAVSLTYIVLYLPYTLSYLLSEFSTCTEILEISNLMYHYGFCLRYLSHSSAFYCYIITGRRFRNDFISIACKLRLKLLSAFTKISFCFVYVFCCFSCLNSKFKIKYMSNNAAIVKTTVNKQESQLNSHITSSSIDTVTAAALCANLVDRNSPPHCSLLHACSMRFHYGCIHSNGNISEANV